MLLEDTRVMGRSISNFELIRLGIIKYLCMIVCRNVSLSNVVDLILMTLTHNICLLAIPAYHFIAVL